MIDWTDAFENGAYIDGAAEMREQWQTDAAALRESHGKAVLGVSYGDAPRNAYDLFHAAAPKGTVIFVHGGYWHQTDRSWWSHLAAGPLAHGWSVAMPSYTLAPEARISRITAEIAQAITAIAAAQDGPLRLIGHSAGGHLVSRMVCPGVLSAEVRDRIEHTVSVSGVHHLEPLMKARMNEVLQLDATEAALESPALTVPEEGISITFWVGAAERPEFLRQNRLIGERWSQAGAAVDEHYLAGENHFSVIDQLRDPESPLTQRLLSQLI